MLRKKMVVAMASYSNYTVKRDRKSANKSNVFERGRNRNKKMENMGKSERLMNGVATWTSYYRLYPHVFVKDYLGVDLKLFQTIILYFMMHDNYVMYIAARG